MLKALLVHSARRPSTAQLIGEVFGPADPRRTSERDDNIARLLGHGVPNIARVLDCGPHQATLLGYGEIEPETGRQFEIPLPQCLESVTDPRELIITLAWFSPVSTTRVEYRDAQLYLDAPPT